MFPRETLELRQPHRVVQRVPVQENDRRPTALIHAGERGIGGGRHGRGDERAPRSSEFRPGQSCEPPCNPRASVRQLDRSSAGADA